MNASAFLREMSKSLDSGLRARLEENVVTDQCHTFEVTCFIPAGVERAPVVRTDQAVCLDEADHPKGVDRTFG